MEPWWYTMLGITVLNLVLLIATSTKQKKLAYSDELVNPPLPQRERTLVRAGALVFTLVCGYRSVLPRIDVPRVCWFNVPLNWIVFGRAAATIAEVMWAMQMALVMRRLAISLGPGGVGSLGQLAVGRACRAAKMVVGMACLAECFSWTNLITGDNVFAVVEQGLWSLLFLTVGVGMSLLSRHVRQKAFLVFGVLAIAMGVEQGYEAYGMYLVRFIADQKHHKAYNGFVEGIKRLASCSLPISHTSDTWFSDATWMTGYFSVGVWTSIWLSIAPFPAQRHACLLPRDFDSRDGNDNEAPPTDSTNHHASHHSNPNSRREQSVGK